MKPLAVLLGIIMGSTVAMAVSLAMTAVVFLLLPEYAVRLSSEHAPLLRGLAWSWSLAALAAASFIGELRGGRWRRPCQAVLFLLLALLAWHYWPRQGPAAKNPGQQSSTTAAGPRGIRSLAKPAVVGIDASVTHGQGESGSHQRGLDARQHRYALSHRVILGLDSRVPAIDINTVTVELHWLLPSKPTLAGRIMQAHQIRANGGSTSKL